MPLIDPGPIRFRATLQRSDASGAACWVDFPHDLKATFGKGNLVPVVAVYDGRVTYRGSLAMMGGPRAMLLCRKDVLAQLGKGPGDEVEVEVVLDTAPREVTLSEEAQTALAADPVASAAWARLAPSHRREYAQWIAEAKRQETRASRIGKMLTMLAEGRRLT